MLFPAQRYQNIPNDKGELIDLSCALDKQKVGNDFECSNDFFLNRTSLLTDAISQYYFRMYE